MGSDMAQVAFPHLCMLTLLIIEPDHGCARKMDASGRASEKKQRGCVVRVMLRKQACLLSSRRG